MSGQTAATPQLNQQSKTQLEVAKPVDETTSAIPQGIQQSSVQEVSTPHTNDTIQVQRPVVCKELNGVGTSCVNAECPNDPVMGNAGSNHGKDVLMENISCVNVDSANEKVNSNCSHELASESREGASVSAPASLCTPPVQKIAQLSLSAADRKGGIL